MNQKTKDERPETKDQRASGVTERLARGLRFSRLSLCAIGLPIVMASIADNPAVDSFLRYVYMLIGFSVIIFVHELGHFLVARACKVKCPVFSIGMGHRLCGWKKGIGFTFGPEPGSEKDKEAKEDTAVLATNHADLEFAKPRPPLPEGETDYRISMLPIGGYVRMLGQDDMDPTKISTDPNSYNSKPIWQRMCIISAGVIMNVIFAVIIFAIVFKVGIDRPGPVVGKVQYDSPAYKAGMHMGDRILAANRDTDNPKLEFMDVLIASALSGGQPVHYRWTPYGGGPVHDQYITPTKNDSSGLLMIGVSPIPDLKFPAMTKEERDEFLKDFPALKDGDVHGGDRIVRVDGKPVNDFVELHRATEASNGNPLTLDLHNDDPKIVPADHQIKITPKLMVRDGVKDDQYPTIAGFIPRVAVNVIQPDSPAEKAGLLPGDAIARVNEIQNPTIQQMIDTMGGNAGNKVTIVIDRDGTTKTITATPVDSGKGGRIQMVPIWDTAHPIIAGVAADHPALKGVIPGSKVLAIDGQKIESWNDVHAYLRRVIPEITPGPTDSKSNATMAALPTLNFTLQLPAPEGKTPQVVQVAVAMTKTDQEDLAKLEYNLGIPLEVATELQRADTIGGAISMGMNDTKKFIIQTYLTLYGLIFSQTISPNQLHGALGIAKVGHDIQEKGFIHLLFLLGVISVNLAVANFLPLPIVDGGHFLLLIVEKLRGKRLAPKIELTIQYVGLFLIIGMLLFVTYNDIGLFRTK